MQQLNNRSRLFADVAEAALVATVLARPEMADRVRHLPPENFGQPEYGNVFSAVLEATETPLDGEAALVAVAELLQRDGHFAGIGGAAGLCELSRGGITAHPEVTAAEISRAAAARTVTFGLEELLREISPESLADVQDRLREISRVAETAGQASTLKVTTMADIQAESIRWLWPGWLASGKFHLTSGPPGTGKSFFTMDLAARLSNGTVWPDGEPVIEPGDTLLMCAEDDPADGIRPRLDAANADCRRVHILQSVSRPDAQGRFRPQPVDIQRDFLTIGRHLKLHPEIRLVIVDPLAEYMGKADSNSTEQVRNALKGLLEAAAETGAAVLGINHFRKATTSSAIDKSGGSGAFVARARLGAILIPDPEDEGRKMLLQTKNNMAPKQDGLAFEIVNGCVHWSADRITTSADEAIAPKRGPAPTARADAEGWLRDRLRGGRVETRKIDAEAKDRGFSIATLNRARKEIGVVAEQERDGRKPVWFLSLPDAECSAGDF